jgi:hypothetical protein
MAARQIVKTNKRIVFLASGTNNDIGVTASAFLDYGITEGRVMGEGSGITNGSASISKIVSGSESFTVGMAGEILFTGQAAGEYNFERYTLRPVTPDGTLDIIAGTGTVIVEVVL